MRRPGMSRGENMKLTVNGKEEKLGKEFISISGLLDELKVVDALYVTVELNGTILKRENFDRTIVSDGDVVEFLYFMGGGARGCLRIPK
jgi:sulfur carrier protein